MSAKGQQTATVKATKGSERLAANIDQDSVATQGWTAQSTGPTGDQNKAGFDIFPHDVGTDNTAANEKFRDLVSLQPHFGQDRLMGARQYDESMMAYLKGIREKRVK